MRNLILRAMGTLLDWIIIIIILGAVIVGSATVQSFLGALLGLIGGLLFCITFFGPIYLLVDIRERAVKMEGHLRDLKPKDLSSVIE